MDPPKWRNDARAFGEPRHIIEIAEPGEGWRCLKAASWSSATVNHLLSNEDPDRAGMGGRGRGGQCQRRSRCQAAEVTADASPSEPRYST